MKNAIPKAAPATTLEAYGRVQDLMEAVGALRVAGMSDVHSLQLPPEAITALVAAHEALKDAHRAVENALHPAHTRSPGLCHWKGPRGGCCLRKAHHQGGHSTSPANAVALDRRSQKSASPNT